jgi:hypothetical protein
MNRTRISWGLMLPVLSTALLLSSCIRVAQGPEAEEPEPFSRTEFTGRIENYFEYTPLKAGQPSRFLIHLTDLADGSPVEGAQIVLSVCPKGSDREVAETMALIGKVAGTYVAELTIRQPGLHDLEFHVKNGKLDERMFLTNFHVQ